jgi:uncharacterized protein (DUF488 family)
MHTEGKPKESLSLGKTSKRGGTTLARLFTIGFTKKTAEEFFSKLKQAQIRHLLDIRLNNRSQLAGFTKRPDFEYFLMEIGKISYVHLTQLCPTNEILAAYKRRQLTWQQYEERFVDLLKQRHVEDTVNRESLDYGCLLCTEDKPDHCHRRLVGQYLSNRLGNLEIIHL